jgi:hypothetical protein
MNRCYPRMYSPAWLLREPRGTPGETSTITLRPSNRKPSTKDGPPTTIARHMGYQDDQNLKDRLSFSAARNNALDTPIELKRGDARPTAVRQAYADAMITGETIGPDHFAKAYHDAGHPAVEDMTAQLPDHADFTDHALAITNDAGLPLTAEFFQQTKTNLLDAWATTGITPNELYVAAVNDPRLSDALTNPPPPPPEPAEIVTECFVSCPERLLPDPSRSASKPRRRVVGR